MGNHYSLEERTLNFSKLLLQTLKKLKRSIYNENLIKQIMKSGSSVGANYREANGAESKKDFNHKIRICLKEAKETDYWLVLLIADDSGEKENLAFLLREAKELTLIFGKICSTCKENEK